MAPEDGDELSGMFVAFCVGRHLLRVVGVFLIIIDSTDTPERRVSAAAVKCSSMSSRLKTG